jgi:hypothetical protein
MSEIEYDDMEFVEELEQEERRGALTGDLAIIEQALDQEIARTSDEDRYNDEDDEPAKPAVTPSDLRAAYESVGNDYDLGSMEDSLLEAMRARPELFPAPQSQADIERNLRTAAAMVEQGNVAARNEALRTANELLEQRDIDTALDQLSRTLDPNSDTFKRFVDGLEDEDLRMAADDWRAGFNADRGSILEQLQQAAEYDRAVAEQEEAERQAAQLMVALQKAVDRHPDANELSLEAARNVVEAIEAGFVAGSPQDAADLIDVSIQIAREDKRVERVDGFGSEVLARANGYIWENGRMVDPRDGSIVEGVGALEPDYSGITTSADDLSSSERKSVFLDQFSHTAIRPKSDFAAEMDKAYEKARKQEQVRELKRRGLIE